MSLFMTLKRNRNDCTTPEVGSPMTPTTDSSFLQSTAPLLFDDQPTMNNQPPRNIRTPPVPMFPKVQMMSPNRNNRQPPPPTPFRGRQRNNGSHIPQQDLNSGFVLDNSGASFDDELGDLLNISPHKGVDDDDENFDEIFEENDEDTSRDSGGMNSRDSMDGAFVITENPSFHSNPFSPDKRMNISSQSTGQNTRYNNSNSSNYYSMNNSQNQSRPKVRTYFSRYGEDFEEVQLLGHGSFGKVVKCLNRFDGVHYAIKISTRVIRGERHCNSMLREVHALAALSDNPYIVRYYGSWIENGRVFVQTEFCEGGSLSDKFDNGHRFSEKQLIEMINQVGTGLHMMHSQNLVHMDVKPENIFIKGKGYKIGDLGFVASSLEFNRDVLEGDCRYLSREILDPRATQIDLKKVDIFALGASVLELASGTKLPQNGKDWNILRDGKIPFIRGFSLPFMNMIKAMMHPNPNKRPTADQIIQSKIVSQCRPSYEQLYQRNLRLELMLTNLARVEENLRREIEFLRKDNDNKMMMNLGNSGGGIDIFSSSV